MLFWTTALVLLLLVPQTAPQTVSHCVAGWCAAGPNVSWTAAEGCPPLSFSYAPGASSLANCSCVPGTFGANSSVCAPCAAGSFSGTPGLTACTACPQSAYCAPGSSAITPCAAGSYCPTPSVQTACSAGTFSGSTGATSAASCTSCATGNYCPAGSANQSACPKGYYCPTPAASVACAAGTYSSSLGATSVGTCVSCATYSSSIRVARTDASACGGDLLVGNASLDFALGWQQFTQKLLPTVTPLPPP